MRIEEALSPEGRGALLGIAIGPAANLFDPGGMGSYFQTPHEVARSLKILRAVPQLGEYCEGLARAVNNSRGLLFLGGLWGFAFIVYWASKLYRRSQGESTSDAYKELPIE